MSQRPKVVTGALPSLVRGGMLRVRHDERGVRGISGRIRQLVVAVMLCGWLVLANHCALAAWAGGALHHGAQSGQAAEETSCCHQSRKGESSPLKNEGVRLDCCQSMQALVPDAARAMLPVPFVLPEMMPVFVDLFAGFSDGNLLPAGVFADGGPPDEGWSFVEEVLHRSLQAHAPPIRA